MVDYNTEATHSSVYFAFRYLIHKSISNIPIQKIELTVSLLITKCFRYFVKSYYFNIFLLSIIINFIKVSTLQDTIREELISGRVSISQTWQSENHTICFHTCMKNLCLNFFSLFFLLNRFF